MHITSKTLKNIATDRYVFLFVLSVTGSVVSLSKSFKLLVSKTFSKTLSTYDTAKCVAFTKIVTIWLQSVEFLIAIMTSDSNILAQVLYQDQRDVICSNKKCRGKKYVYLTSFEEINKSTYQCKHCKSCSHVLNIPLKDQKHAVPYLVGPTTLKKDKVRLPKRETLASNATVHQPIKTLHNKSRGS